METKIRNTVEPKLNSLGKNDGGIEENDIVAILYEAFFSKGRIGFMATDLVIDLDITILVRFAKVFEQTYTRFLDLQKAEAQAREAQIEVALERVRSKSLAMHLSDELQKVVIVVFDQLKELDIEMDFSGIHIFEEGSKNFNLWLATQGRDYTQQVIIPYFKHRAFDHFFKIREKGVLTLAENFTKKEKNTFFKHANIPEIPEKRIKFILESPGWSRFSALTKNAALVIANYEGKPYTESDQGTIKRFAQVFEQAYTRFLDLQKAEAQAREAQIDAALERVRARAMAMHDSSELADTSTILFEQFTDLDINVRRCGFALPSEDAQKITIWSTARDEDKKAMLISAYLRHDQHPLYSQVIDAWLIRKQSYFTYELHDRNLQDYYKSWKKTFDISTDLMDNVLKKNKSEYYQFSFFNKGLIYAFTAKPLDKGELRVLNRFSTAFELTYRRFLDLQNAEKRAREAEIEAAMERVRSKATAMHSSEDLSATVTLLNQELETLGVHPLRCGFGRLDEEKKTVELLSISGTKNLLGEISLIGNPTIKEIYDHWLQQKEYHPVLKRIFQIKCTSKWSKSLKYRA